MVEVLYLGTDSVDAMDLPMDVALQVPVAFGDVALQMHVEVGYLQKCPKLATKWPVSPFSRAYIMKMVNFSRGVIYKKKIYIYTV